MSDISNKQVIVDLKLKNQEFRQEIKKSAQELRVLEVNAKKAQKSVETFSDHTEESARVMGKTHPAFQAMSQHMDELRQELVTLEEQAIRFSKTQQQSSLDWNALDASIKAVEKDMKATSKEMWQFMKGWQQVQQSEEKMNEQATKSVFSFKMLSNVLRQMPTYSLGPLRFAFDALQMALSGGIGGIVGAIMYGVIPAFQSLTKHADNTSEAMSQLNNIGVQTVDTYVKMAKAMNAAAKSEVQKGLASALKNQVEIEDKLLIIKHRNEIADATRVRDSRRLIDITNMTAKELDGYRKILAKYHGDTIKADKELKSYMNNLQAHEDQNIKLTDKKVVESYNRQSKWAKEYIKLWNDLEKERLNAMASGDIKLYQLYENHYAQFEKQFAINEKEKVSVSSLVITLQHLYNQIGTDEIKATKTTAKTTKTITDNVKEQTKSITEYMSLLADEQKGYLKMLGYTLPSQIADKQQEVLKKIKTEWDALTDVQKKDPAFLSKFKERIDQAYDTVRIGIDQQVTLVEGGIDEMVKRFQEAGVEIPDEMKKILNEAYGPAMVEQILHPQLVVTREFKQKLFEVWNDPDELARLIKEYMDKAGEEGYKDVEKMLDAIDKAVKSKTKASTGTFAVEFEKTMNQAVKYLGEYYTQSSKDLVDTLNKQEQALEQSYNQGTISYAEYNQKKQDIAKRSANATRKAAYDSAVAQKYESAFSIAVDTAKGVMKYLADKDKKMALATAILGAIQEAMVLAKPLPKFAKGGEIGGKRHSDGGELIEAEQGEYIINRDSYMANAKLVQGINSTSGNYLPQLLQGVGGGGLTAQDLKNLKIYVTVADIQKATNSYNYVMPQAQ